jgi:ABC-type branched-subunit amino acid transport system ATPase component
VPVGAVICKRSEQNGTHAEPLLVLDGVSRSFGGLHALSDVSLDLGRGELFGLVGPNGSGKTTLLNVLSGVYKPSKGRIVIGGRSLEGVYGQPHLITAHGLARTFQGIRLVRGRSVLDNVMLGAYRIESASLPSTLAGVPSSRAEIALLRERAFALLGEFGIEDIADRDVAGLPYGPQRKVEIARALMPEPRLLLLDEPTAGMTMTERQQIFDLMHAMRERGITVVVVEHDIEAITEHCSRMAVLNFGEVIAQGEPRDVFQERTVMDAYIGQRAHD